MQKQQGSTLIEVLIAVSVVATVMTAVMSMMAMSVRVAQVNEQRQLALQKAQETTEFFKRERAVNSWNTFSTQLSQMQYCLTALPDSVTQMSNYVGPCGTTQSFLAAGFPFYREIEIAKPNNSTIEMTINLRWNDSGTLKTVSLEQEFKEY